MPTPNPRLAYTYRVLADTALTVGAITLILAIALPATGTPIGLPLVATTLIAGLIAIAAATGRRRYQPNP